MTSPLTSEGAGKPGESLPPSRSAGAQRLPQPAERHPPLAAHRRPRSRAGAPRPEVREVGPRPLPAPLSAPDHDRREDAFVQRALWPLFHDLAPLARFEIADWQAFRAVNRRLARALALAAARGPTIPAAPAIAATLATPAAPATAATSEIPATPATPATPGIPATPASQATPPLTDADRLWAHDPLLMGLALELRRLRVPVSATYFMRLPFPAPDLLLRLPWRERLLAALLAFDRLGFQTRRDLGNFLECAQLVFPAVAAHRGEDGRFYLSGRAGLRWCEIVARVCPEGVDAAAISRAAGSAEVERRLTARRAGPAAGGAPAGDGSRPGRAGGRGHQWLLAIDALSPEQGTPEKLRAFAVAVELQPALRESASLLLVVEPGPFGGTPEAASLRREIERLVGEVNGRLGRAGWVPVQYRFQQLPAADRLALYRAADVALMTPLRAGMGLTAKEYCAADLDERGALVLSEFAGAASQLAAGAWLVNPHDAGATARALVSALRAGADERRRRMRWLRAEVMAHDLAWWIGELMPETRPAPATARTMPAMARIGNEGPGEGVEPMESIERRS
jgi:trehalose-6-phosphate synthase